MEVAESEFRLPFGTDVVNNRSALSRSFSRTARDFQVFSDEYVLENIESLSNINAQEFLPVPGQYRLSIFCFRNSQNIRQPFRILTKAVLTAFSRGAEKVKAPHGVALNFFGSVYMMKSELISRSFATDFARAERVVA